MKYRPAVDVFRLLAASLVVCFHSPGSPYKQLTISGLGYFVLLTFCLQGLSQDDGRPFPLRDRARRLLIPWVSCTIFYLGLHWASRHAGPIFSTGTLNNLGLLLTGFAPHLWFLPFAFVGGIATFFLKRASLRLTEAGALISLLLLAGALAISTVTNPSLPMPFGQWAACLPLLPIGLAIGMAQRLRARRLAWHYAAILAVTSAIAWSRAEVWYLLSVMALLASILPRSREIVGLRWLAGLSMGIYLMHPFFFLMIYKYLPGLNWAGFTAVALLGSAALSGLATSVPRIGTLMFGTVHRPDPASWRSPTSAPSAEQFTTKLAHPVP